MYLLNVGILMNDQTVISETTEVYGIFRSPSEAEEYLKKEKLDKREDYFWHEVLSLKLVRGEVTNV